MLYVRLMIKVKVGIPESFKVGLYPHKITGPSHLKCKIINKNNNSCFKVPGKKDLENLRPPPCLLLSPLPIGISDALHGGKYKPHPGVEGNGFHFLMNLCRYTCNSSWSHCKLIFP